MQKRIVVLIFVLTVSCLFLFSRADSAENIDHDCSKCHKLTNEDALGILKDGIPEVKIREIRPAPLKGLWEVVFESGGQRGLLYLEFSKQKAVIIGSGGIIDLKTRTNLTAQRIYEINKVDVSLIPLDEALVMGDKNASKKIIVFTDPD